MTLLPPLDFVNRLDWADEIILLHRRALDGAPARIRVWAARVDGEIHVRSPRGTSDPWARDIHRADVVLVTDGRRLRARADNGWRVYREKERVRIDQAFADRYAHVPPFAARIRTPRARAATVCLRARDDDRLPPWIPEETRDAIDWRAIPPGMMEDTARRLGQSL